MVTSEKWKWLGYYNYLVQLSITKYNNSMIIGPTLLNVLKLEPVKFNFKYVGIGIDFVHCAKPKKC